MGPLWPGQGTVPHTTLSDLLSTDLLVSPSGALTGAEKHIDVRINNSLMLKPLEQICRCLYFVLKNKVHAWTETSTLKDFL